MIEAYESTFSIRLVLALLVFGGLLVFDLLRHGPSSPRLREYGFLLVAMSVAVGYGIIHDQISATISPEYFLIGKGLADDSLPFRLSVTLLAFRATYGIGLLGGAFFLIANNPSRRTPQLSYGTLVRLGLIPPTFAAICAAAGGLLFASNAVTFCTTMAEAIVGKDLATQFLVTWGMHAGSYLGGAVGIVIALVFLVRRRRKIVAVELSPGPIGELF